MTVKDGIILLSNNPNSLSITLPSSIVYEIISTPLNLNSQSTDNYSWKPAKNGVFSIKSCYALLLHMSMNCSDSVSKNFLWIWKLQIHTRFKLFLWQIMHNSLATSVKLFKRKIINSPTCPGC